MGAPRPGLGIIARIKRRRSPVIPPGYRGRSIGPYVPKFPAPNKPRGNFEDK